MMGKKYVWYVRYLLEDEEDICMDRGACVVGDCIADALAIFAGVNPRFTVLAIHRDKECVGIED